MVCCMVRRAVRHWKHSMSFFRPGVAARSPAMAPTSVPRALVVIALYKLVKTAACLALAAVAFNLVHPEVELHFSRWLESLTWITRYGIVMRSIDWLLNLAPTQFRAFGMAALVYAALYAVQGYGLWFGKRWAEYLVIGETCLLLPVELWELAHRSSVLKVVVLVANVAVVVYLIGLLRRNAHGVVG